MGKNLCLVAIASAWLFGVCNANADGCFVFVWNKQKDINEPTQKAIILHDNGREDLVLQVKYEGPAEDFGWLIPVPGLPEVRKGSMDCFYEASRLTQRRFGSPGGARTRSAGVKGSHGEDTDVKVIEVKTVGAYEVSVLSATNAASLREWLDDHHFTFPVEKQNVLEDYVKKQWYFVAAKIDPNQDGFAMAKGTQKRSPDRTAIPPSTRKKLASGELHPLVISFPSEKCVFPLAISAVNGKPSEISLYVISSEPLTSRVIFDKKFAAYSKAWKEKAQQAAEEQKPREARMKELDVMLAKCVAGLGPAAGDRVHSLSAWDDDPADPPPAAATMRKLLGIDWPMKIGPDNEEDFYGYDGGGLLQNTYVEPKYLPACSKEMPRLAGKSWWWLNKQVEIFAPGEMRDLEFESAVPILAAKLGTAEGLAAAACLMQLGRPAVPAVLEGVKSSNPKEHRFAAFAMTYMTDVRLVAAVPGLLEDPDPRVRRSGCSVAEHNWDATFVPHLKKVLDDADEQVRSMAAYCLFRHRDDIDSQTPVYRKPLVENEPPASMEITLLETSSLPRGRLVAFFASPNLPVVATAFNRLRDQNLRIYEIESLLNNNLAMARMMGLEALADIGDKNAVDRIFAMLRDPNEGVRWNVRARLRRLTGQKLGPDTTAWEKWWDENIKSFTPQPLSRTRLEPP